MVLDLVLRILSLSVPTDSLFQPNDFCYQLITVFTKALLRCDDTLLPHSATVLLDSLRKFGITDGRFIKQVREIATSMGW